MRPSGRSPGPGRTRPRRSASSEPLGESRAGQRARLILASASPRRRQLLTRLDIPFETVAPGLDEQPCPNEEPEETCLRLAGEKALQVARRYPHDLVIGADTIVILHGQALGKPADLDEARRMLRTLSGQTHLVKTAVALAILEPEHRSGFVETTEVTFYPLDEEDIERYLATAPPLDKAGAYGIQDLSGVFVQQVNGCYHNVMGFPLARFYQHLKTTGLWHALTGTKNL